MAYQLVADVLDHAPDDITSGELAVLVAIAEWAPVTTRQTKRHAKELGRRARLRPRGLQAALLRLAQRGLEVRVKLRDENPSAKYPTGRPIYAVPGTVTLFRLPVFVPPAGCTCDPCTRGHAVPHPSNDKGTLQRHPGHAVTSGRARHSAREGTSQRARNGSVPFRSARESDVRTPTSAADRCEQDSRPPATDEQRARAVALAREGMGRKGAKRSAS